MKSGSLLTQAELTSAIVRDPLIVAPDTTVIDGIAEMSGIRTVCWASKAADSQDELYTEARSSCVLIVEGKQILGILTERDIVRLSAQKRALDNLPIREVMTHPIITLRESAFTDLFFAVNLLQQHHIRHLPLINEEDEIVGILTHESLRQTSRPVDLLRLRIVAEIMTPNVICADPSTSMLEIAQLMAGHKVSSVIIVKTETGIQNESLQIPMGIVTERDIVQFQALNLNLETCQAQSVMSTPIFSVNMNDSLLVVQQIMERQLIRRLAVTGKEGELLGIVTQTSLLQLLNPLELYKLAEVLEQKVLGLEAEKVELLETRTIELEQQVEERTAALRGKAEQEKLIATITSQIRSSLNLQDILDTTVKEVRSLLKCDRADIWRFQSNSSVVVLAESVIDGQLTNQSKPVQDSCFDWKKEYSNRTIRVVDDIYTTEMTECHRQLLENLQTRAKILVPIFQAEILWGLLTVIESHTPRNWQPEEISLIQQLGTQLEIAIQQATAYEKLQTELMERRKLEAELRKSEQRFASLAQSAPVGIFRTDIAGNCLFVNQRWCEIAGVSPNEALGTGWTQGLHPEDRQIISAEWYQSTRENRPFKLEYRFLRPDSTFTWVFGQALAEKDEDGEIVGYIGTITDISDAKEISLILENLIARTSTVTGREFFPALAEHIHNAFGLNRILITELRDDKFIKLVDWNNQESEADSANEDLAELYAKSDLGITLQNQNEETIGYMAMWNKKIKNSPNLGNIIDILQVFAGRAEAEIERIRVNEVLQQRNQELQEAQAALEQLNQSLEAKVEERTAKLKEREAQLCQQNETLQTIFDHIPLMIGLFSATGEILMINREMEQVIGWREEEYKEVDVIAACYPDLAEYQKVIQHMLTANSTWQDFQTRVRDGRNLITTWAQIRLSNGSTIGIGQDITGRKQAEMKLQETNQKLAISNEQLARATRMKDEFLANMSHELRTPLNVILGMTEGLQEQVFGPISLAQLKACKTIERSGNHLLELINDILDLAKIEAGQIELNCTRTSVSQICQSSLPFVKHQALQKQIQLEANILPSLPDLLVDELRIKQVLINLLNNAIKFTAVGGSVTLNVTLEQPISPPNFLADQTTTSLIRFAVIDTGIGISPENIKNLFQPFVQIDSALNRQYSGTGLGLSLVKRMVELHGGSVGVKSELGVGSCFTIDLPCGNLPIQSPESLAQGLPNLETTLGERVVKASPLILLAEDNEANISTISNYLTAKGYRIILAQNGQEAIDLAKSNLPDLILMDIQMPEIDGLEAIKEIRRNEKLVNIPIIAMTALAMKGDRERCIEAGANDYLSKPLKLKQLTGIIQELLAETKDCK